MGLLEEPGICGLNSGIPVCGELRVPGTLSAESAQTAVALLTVRRGHTGGFSRDTMTCQLIQERLLALLGQGPLEGPQIRT